MFRWSSGFRWTIRCVRFASLRTRVGFAERGVRCAGMRTLAGLRLRRQYILRALLLQVFYSVRSERLLVEQIDYNLLFRWFVGLGMDDAMWNHAVFSKNATAF